MSVKQIKDGVVVSATYKMVIDGEVIEEADANDPLQYLHGYENIVPGLEDALTGKTVGDKLSVTLQPEDAYGDYDEEDTELVEREDMPDDIAPGMEVVLEDEDGNMFDALIKEIKRDHVVLDFNPPYAGKVVSYDVEVVGLREADEDELETGFPAGYEYELD